VVFAARSVATQGGTSLGRKCNFSVFQRGFQMLLRETRAALMKQASTALSEQCQSAERQGRRGSWRSGRVALRGCALPQSLCAYSIRPTRLRPAGVRGRGRVGPGRHSRVGPAVAYEECVATLPDGRTPARPVAAARTPIIPSP